MMQEILPTNDDQSTEDIIKTDADTQKEYGDAAADFDLSKAIIAISEDYQSVFQFVRKESKGLLVLDPDFQRNLVWKPYQKSRFIESILLNFPIPPFYVNEQIDGKWAIIDGLQRTKTLIEFLDNNFALSDLKGLSAQNGKKFQDLKPELQARIEDKKLSIHVLKSSTSMEVIYELFDRINTGGTPLNRQEVRHCILKGKSTELLAELSTKDYFKQAIDNGIAPTRMKDREIILRFFAFYLLDKNEYRGDLSEFIERAMKKINTFENADLDKLRAVFEKVMRFSYDFFGKQNFRCPAKDSAGAVVGRGFINTGMFESISVFLANQTEVFLSTHKEKIIQNFEKLLNDPQYFDAIRFSTGTKSRVINRFELANKILGNV